jgi:hypothetical protein
MKPEFYALTCIDLATNFPEAMHIRNKTASHASLQFENIWLLSYPWLMRCVHDQGTEFIGAEFQYLLMHAGIKDVPTTVCNPQANAVCKRLHQSATNILQNLCSQNPSASIPNVSKLVDTEIATSLHATHSTVHHTLQDSP